MEKAQTEKILFAQIAEKIQQLKRLRKQNMGTFQKIGIQTKEIEKQINDLWGRIRSLRCSKQLPSEIDLTI